MNKIDREKSLGVRYPEKAKFWHPTKNGELTPYDVTPGTQDVFWWVCENGHEYPKKMKEHIRSGCAYCSGRKVLAGFNDLATTHPQIAAEWHPTKNGDLKPTDVTHGQGIDVWWICKEGHEWPASICNRTNKSYPNKTKFGSGCPYCSHQLPIIGVNDLATLYPEVAKEWHPTKNGDLTPSDVTYAGSRSVYWMCEHGHEWPATVVSRTLLGNRCGRCTSTGMSKPEVIILEYIKKHAGEDNVVHRYKELGFEIDIYIKSLKVGIEYDGKHFHGNRIEKDCQKNKKCIDNGITLYRIRENGLDELDGGSIDIYCNPNNLKSLGVAIKEVLYKIFEETVDVNIRKDIPNLPALIGTAKKNRSLAITHPEIAAEWHPTKNGTLTPEMFSSGSRDEVWWLNSKGEEWKQPIHRRIYK